MKPDTIARSLAIGAPADGFYALQVARTTGGEIEACTEDEIVDGIRLLAETEGVFTETAGGRHDRRPEAVGGARRHRTRRGDRRVRDRERLQDDRRPRGRIEPSFHVEPDLDGFLAALGI